MRTMFVMVIAALSVVAVTVGATSAPAATALVVNSNDAGPGSFRAAVTAANSNSAIDQIVFTGNLAPIRLQSGVLYDGDQSLKIVGNGATIVGSDLDVTPPEDAFVANTPGDLSVMGLTFRDVAGEALEYQVPSDASGTKHVSLNGVTVFGHDPDDGDPEDMIGGHGVLLNDQMNPETSDPAGSDASLDVTVTNSVFDQNGFGALDRDGLRVNEGGDGDLTFVVRNSVATKSGGDGIELDERADGNAVFTVSGSKITENGSFHDLFPPDDPDDLDLDDGVDVDESGDGDVIGSVTNSVANDNFEEGWDINENDAGDMRFEMTNAEASRNREEGVDLEEDDDFAGGGDLITLLRGVIADDNTGGDAGIKIRERGDGGVDAKIRGAHANGNDEDGINLREDDTGNLLAIVQQSVTNENGDDGVNFEENANGDLTTTAAHGTSSGNDDDGVIADQGGSGAGTFDVLFMTFAGNGGDDVAVAGNVTVAQKP